MSGPSSFGHSHCLLCGAENPSSFRLHFEPDGAGSVSCRFRGRPTLQGYDGLLHGGVIAALLDSAMTHCLFHAGIRAVTAELRIRYLRPVPFDAELDLSARLIASDQRLHRLEGALACQSLLLARAEARFMPRRD